MSHVLFLVRGSGLLVRSEAVEAVFVLGLCAVLRWEVAEAVIVLGCVLCFDRRWLRL